MRQTITTTAVLLMLCLVSGAVPAGGDTQVDVGHGSFEPSELTIEVGEKVVFRNTAKMPGGHTVVLDNADAASEGLGKGESWRYTFDEPGTYHFHVKEHPDNKGTVSVKKAGDSGGY